MRGAKVPKRPGLWEALLPMDELRAGLKIVVYTGRRVELGEGTFVRRTVHPDLNMVAYECEEHTILARGDHFIRLHGRLQFVLAIHSGVVHEN